MGIKLTNNAFATLASSITSSSTSITLTTGQGARFPSLSGGDYFYATLVDTSNNLEIVKCTARSTDVLTVTRAQESTTARAYSTGDRIEIRITAQTFVDATTFNPTPAEVSDELNSSTGYFDMPAGTTAQRPGSPVAGMQRWNTDLVAMEYYNGTAWSQAFLQSYNIDYLIVAGGGGGGSSDGAAYYGGGGGGAGGYLAGSMAAIGNTAYSITVGSGGGGGSGGARGTSGNNSTAFTQTSVGGGGGGGWNVVTGGSGGSGGGARSSGPGGSGTAGQGNQGGSATETGAGGGGACAAGVKNFSTTNGSAGGAGGNWQSLGTFYAGGGGGGSYSGGSSGAGGTGGGGSGGSAGTANTGGGGGGGNSGGVGLSGGSGIVIVRYSGTTQRGTGGTVTTAGGYTYHTFTSSGTFTA
jgi:hypothetical protein